MKPLNPESLASPSGYNNGMLSETGRILFVAGQIGWDKNKQLAKGLVDQFDRALENVIAVVRQAGGSPEHIGRITIYITDRHEYLFHKRALGEVYRKRMGNHYPAMSLVIVKALLEEDALTEIEATAMIP